MQVKPTGPKDCSICFIGEAPGETEVQTGEPFTGASGKLLTSLMLNAGIHRTKVYIRNVVMERPPNNDIEHFLKIASNGKVSRMPAYEAYEQELYADLESVKANVFVAVGNVALYALTRRTNVTATRGSILTITASANLAGRKLIPIIHPSAALRQHLYTYYIAHDLQRIKEESHSPELKLPERQMHIWPTYEEVLSYIASCWTNPGPIAIDIEVVNEEVFCLCIALAADDILVVPFMREGADYWLPGQELEIWQRLGKVLEDPNILKIGQNIIFDATFIFRKYGIICRNMADTMIGQAILAPDMPKGLDFITSLYTREPYYKDEGKKYFRMSGSEETFMQYNAKDGAVCLEAYPKIVEDLRKQNNLPCLKRQTALITPLMYMQERGLRVDVAGLKKASAESKKQIAELQEQLNTTAGRELNAASPKQLAQYFYNEKGAKAYIDRKTGNVTTNEDAMKRLARKGFKEASIILEMRGLQKLCGTYYDMEVDDDNRVRCAFNPVGTKSGRLSSGKTIFGSGGNMQNLPPEFKKFVIADDGFTLYNIDLSQAENRVVAYIAPEQRMIAAFEGGRDIHSQTAGLIFGIPPEQISDEKGSCPIGGGQYSQRFWGKKANHGLNYDLGYKTFAFYYEIEEREAKLIVDAYHAAYPGVHKYHAWVKDCLRNGMTLVSPTGSRRRFFDRWGDQLFKEAYSWIPQRTIADIINERGLLFIYGNLPIDLANQVHDSIVLQIETRLGWRRHAELLAQVRESLETPIEWRAQKFSIPADIAVGLNLSAMKKVRGRTIDELTASLESIHEPQVV